MWSQVLGAAFGLLNIQTAGIILGGVVIGVVGGAMPGISPSITIALMLPLSFKLDPTSALVLLGAVYMAAEYAGSISAILINTPGTAGAVCTALEGYPMAKQGRAQEALHASVISAASGGLFGVLVLLCFTPALAAFSLRFGSPEMFWLAIAGLAIVCNLTARDFSKGVIAASIGLFIATIGYDPLTGVPRFAFGNPDLQNGIGLVPAILGFFAIPQMLELICDNINSMTEVQRQAGSFGRMVRYIFSRPALLLRSSLIGTLVGILPGAGASIAGFLSYSEAKRFSKTPEAFGTGTLEGIVATEAANNAVVGGSLVPLLSFGIPGSASAAVLFGAIAYNGLVPGSRMFIEHGNIVYAFMVSFVPILAAMLLVGSICAPWFVRVLRVRNAFIVPTVMVLATIGAYSFRNSFVDVYIMAACGLLGFALRRFGFSLPAVVLGLILGPMAESGFRRSLTLGEIKGSVWLYFFDRPICLVLIAITIAMVVSAFWQDARLKRRERRNSKHTFGAGHGQRSVRPHNTT